MKNKKFSSLEEMIRHWNREQKKRSITVSRQAEDIIDLGWIREGEAQEPKTLEEQRFDLLSSYLTGSHGDPKLLSYIINYPNVEKFLVGHDHILQYKLNTKWFLSEIEDVLRYSMFLHSKIVFELPLGMTGEHVNSGQYYEGPGSYRYTFFNKESLKSIFEKFGDSISGKEFILLPHVVPTASEGKYGETLPPSTYNDYYHSVLGTWRCLSRAENLGIQNVQLSSDYDDELGLPVLAGGDIRELIKLKRDEQESFTRWRCYLSEVMRSSNISEVELFDSLRQGLGELNRDIKILKRKGLLDAICATSLIAGIGVAYGLKEMGYLTATLGLAGGVATAIKAIIEQNHDYKKYSNDPLYFGWLAQRISA